MRRKTVMWTNLIDLLEIGDRQWQFACRETGRVSQIFKTETLAQVAWAGGQIIWTDTI